MLITRVKIKGRLLLFFVLLVLFHFVLFFSIFKEKIENTLVPISSPQLQSHNLTPIVLPLSSYFVKSINGLLSLIIIIQMRGAVQKFEKYFFKKEHSYKGAVCYQINFAIFKGTFIKKKYSIFYNYYSLIHLQIILNLRP